ncbi:MAG: hypothetical protein V8S54_00840 [Lachnospiraceae bacterium]
MDYEIYAEKVIEEIKRSLLSVESSKIALFIKDILAAPQIFCDWKGAKRIACKVICHASGTDGDNGV